MKSKYLEDIVTPWQNIFKDRTLPYFSHLQHPLQHDPAHPAHPDHPENPINVSVHLDPPSSPPKTKEPTLELPIHEGDRSPGMSMGVLLNQDDKTRSTLKESQTITKENVVPLPEIPPHPLARLQDMHSPIIQEIRSPMSDQSMFSPMPESNMLKDPHHSVLSDHAAIHVDSSFQALIGAASTQKKKKKRLPIDLDFKEYVKKKFNKVRNRLHSNIPKVRAKVDKITVDGVHAQTVVIPFLLELGRALHVCGVPAHRLEYELTLVAASFGIDGNYFYTPTGIFCSFGDPSTVLSPYTHLIRVGGADFDLEKLCLLEELALDISQKRLNCSEGISAIHAIMSLPPRYPRMLVILSIILCSFAIAIMFGLGWVEVGVTSLAGMYVALILYLAEKIPAVGRIVEAISGLGCGFIASIFNSYVAHINMFAVALGGVIWFVPGLSITLAVSELATRNLISGTTRLMSAFSCILQLTFGIEAGVKLGEVLLDTKPGKPTNPLPDYWNYIATLICAITFSILLRVPPKQMWAVFVASYLGTLGGQYGTLWLGGSIGAFIGAFLICVFGNLYARIVQKSVSAVPIIAGILLLVPGSLGVKAFNALANNDTSTGIGNIGTMFQTAMSLTMGLLTANLLVRPYKAL